MKRSILLLTLIIAGTLSPNIAQAKVPASEWVLHQNVPDSGENEVYIAEDAVKIVCLKQGYTVIAKGPDWQIACFRPHDKKIWTGKFEQFIGTLLLNPFALPKYVKGNAPADGAVNYEGFKCTVFRLHKDSGAVIFGTKEIPASARACEFIARYFFFDDTGTVPLYRKIYSRRTGRAKITADDKEWLGKDVLRSSRDVERVVLTTSSAHKVPFKASDFEIPKNYERISEVSNIGVSRNQRNQVGEVLDDLGFANAYHESSQTKK